MFGFNKVTHRKYKKNFLKTVIFQISYKKCNFTEKTDDIKKIFQKDFPRFNISEGKGFEISFNNESTSFQEIEESYIITLKSQDGQKIIEISETNLNFTISGKSYECFEELSDNLDNIISFLNLYSISNIDRLEIRKINIVEFKNDEDPSKILTYILNPDLVGYLDFCPNKSSINHCLQVIDYKAENYYLNIKYGLITSPQLNLEREQLVIDIDLYKQENIVIDKMISTSKLINSEIFNIFSWLINENTKKMLDE